MPRHYSVKEAVFPFARFPGVDPVLGPEMRSTGEVMGIDDTVGLAFGKAQLGAGQRLPKEGTVFISVRDADKAAVTPIARKFHELGFNIVATAGTHAHLKEQGVPSRHVYKVSESRPHVVDAMKSAAVDLVINTGGDKVKGSFNDAYMIRRTAVERGNSLHHHHGGGHGHGGGHRGNRHQRPFGRYAIAGLLRARQAVTPWLANKGHVAYSYGLGGVTNSRFFPLNTARIAPMCPQMDLRPKAKDYCGVFGVFGHDDAPRLTYYGLYALQHRARNRRA